MITAPPMRHAARARQPPPMRVRVFSCMREDDARSVMRKSAIIGNIARMRAMRAQPRGVLTRTITSFRDMRV